MSILSPESITPQSLERDILSFLKSLPDTEVWQDYFLDASHGRTLLRLLSAYSAFMSHQARAVRRESNLATARLDSSIRTMAYTLGYPMNRRRAARLRLEAGTDLGNSFSGVVSTSPIIGRMATSEGSFAVSTGNGKPLGSTTSETIICVLGEWNKETGDLPNRDFSEFAFVPRNAAGDALDVSVVDNVIEEVALSNNGDERRGSERIEPGVLVRLGDTASDPITAGVFPEDFNFAGDTDHSLLGDIGGKLDVLVRALISEIVVVFGGNVGDHLVLGRKPPPASTVIVDYLLCPDVATDEGLVFENFAPEGLTKNNVALTASHFRANGNDFLVSRPLPADDAATAARLMPGYFASKRKMISVGDHEAVINSQPQIFECKVVQGQCIGYEGNTREDEFFGYSDRTCTVRGEASSVRTEYLSVPATNQQAIYQTTLNNDVLEDYIHGVYEPSTERTFREAESITPAADAGTYEIPEGKELIAVFRAGGKLEKVAASATLATNQYKQAGRTITFFGTDDITDFEIVAVGAYEYALTGSTERGKGNTLSFHSARQGKGVNVTYNRTVYSKTLTSGSGVITYTFRPADVPNGDINTIDSILAVKIGSDTYTDPAADTGSVASGSNDSDRFFLVKANNTRTLHVGVGPTPLSPTNSLVATFRYNATKWQEPPNNTAGTQIESHQVLISYLPTKGNTDAPQPDTENALTDVEELKATLYPHQMVNEELVFRKATGIEVDVRAQIKLSDPDVEERARKLVGDLIEAQCYKIGGTFDVARFKAAVLALDEVSELAVQAPVESARLSNLAYYKPGQLTLTVMGADALLQTTA